MVGLATAFINGVMLSGSARFLLMLPLCLSVAVVYKATRMENLKHLPVASVVLWVTILLSMYGVGVGLWVLFLIMA